MDNDLHWDQFFLDHYQQHQAFNDRKKSLVVSVTTSRKSSFLLLKTMDQISEANFQIQEVMKNTREDPMEASKVRDTFGMGSGANVDTLGDYQP